MILKKVLKNDHLFLIILIICYEFLLDKNLDITIFFKYQNIFKKYQNIKYIYYNFKNLIVDFFFFF